MPAFAAWAESPPAGTAGGRRMYFFASSSPGIGPPPPSMSRASSVTRSQSASGVIARTRNDSDLADHTLRQNAVGDNPVTSARAVKSSEAAVQRLVAQRKEHSGRPTTLWL